jgi:hypothetical protein
VSTHYLVSLFNDEINDVVGVSGPTPQTLAIGNYVIRVPDDVAVRNPTDVNDLLTQKYNGILGASGLFTQVASDDMLDGFNVDLANSTGVFTGLKGAVGLYPQHNAHTPVLQTTAQGITWGGGGSGPPQAVLTYELFEYVDVDDKSAPYQRYYKEVVPDLDVSAEISFNGGTTFIPTSDKAFIVVPGGDAGTQVVVRFTRTSDVDVRGRVFLGSWAVLF